MTYAPPPPPHLWFSCIEVDKTKRVSFKICPRGRGGGQLEKSDFKRGHDVKDVEKSFTNIIWGGGGGGGGLGACFPRIDIYI